MNIKISIKYIVFIFSCFAILPLKAQFTDPVFTQYMNSMQTINPAYAGMWEKVGAQLFIRRNFTNSKQSPITNSLIFYSPLRRKNNAIGLNFSQDNWSHEKRIRFSVDYAYQIQLSDDIFMRLGLKTVFLNYDNNLGEYELYPDGIPDPVFQDDLHLKMKLNWGVGALAYSEKFYVGISLPGFFGNTFRSASLEYALIEEKSYGYFLAGYVFEGNQQLVFKPGLIIKSDFKNEFQADLTANILFVDKIWFGIMYRTNKTVAGISHFNLTNSLQIGYAAEFPLTYKGGLTQLGKYELRITYEFNSGRRFRSQKHYF